MYIVDRMRCSLRHTIVFVFVVCVTSNISDNHQPSSSSYTNHEQVNFVTSLTPSPSTSAGGVPISDDKGRPDEERRDDHLLSVSLLSKDAVSTDSSTTHTEQVLNEKTSSEKLQTKMKIEATSSPLPSPTASKDQPKSDSQSPASIILVPEPTGDSLSDDTKKTVVNDEALVLKQNTETKQTNNKDQETPPTEITPLTSSTLANGTETDTEQGPAVDTAVSSFGDDPQGSIQASSSDKQAPVPSTDHSVSTDQSSVEASASVEPPLTSVESASLPSKFSSPSELSNKPSLPSEQISSSPSSELSPSSKLSPPSELSDSPPSIPSPPSLSSSPSEPYISSESPPSDLSPSSESSLPSKPSSPTEHSPPSELSSPSESSLGELSPSSEPSASSQYPPMPSSELSPSSEPSASSQYPPMPSSELSPSSEPSASSQSPPMPSSELSASSEPSPSSQSPPMPSSELAPSSEPSASSQSPPMPSSEPSASSQSPPMPSSELASSSEPSASSQSPPMPSSELASSSEPSASSQSPPMPSSELAPSSEPSSELAPSSEPSSELAPSSEPSSELAPSSEPSSELSPSSEPSASSQSPPMPSSELSDDGSEESTPAVPDHDHTAPVRRTPVLLNDSITVDSVSSSSTPEQSQLPPQDSGEDEKERSAGDQEGEDIVTFEEFKAKMSEAVPTNQPQQEHVAVPPLSKSNNNYASSECGAKVMATNPEAKNPGAILMENKDVYMLNPCSAEKWFVVELCELVNVNIVEMASFELFSSVPEAFALYTSDRYSVASPNSYWEKVTGVFHMANERTVQNFPVDINTYVKYVKVEMLSHFGSEHFCPLSMLRVFGTTMMEEYEYSESQRDQNKQQHQQSNGEGAGGGRLGASGDHGDDESPTIPVNPEFQNGEAQAQDKDNPIFAATGAIWSAIGKAVNGLMAQEKEPPTEGHHSSHSPAGVPPAPSGVGNPSTSKDATSESPLKTDQDSLHQQVSSASIQDSSQPNLPSAAGSLPDNAVPNSEREQSMSTIDKDAPTFDVSKRSTSEDASVNFSELGPTDILKSTATSQTSPDLPPTVLLVPSDSEQSSILTDPPTVYPSPDQGSPQPDRHTDLDCCGEEDKEPPVAPSVTSHDKNETKTEALPLNEPPLSPPPFPSPPSTTSSFQEKLTETLSDRDAGGRDMTTSTSTSQQGSDGVIGETKIVSHSYDFPSENGALEKPDMFSQGPTVGVSEDTSASESAQHSEDKQTSLINNTNRQANISCNGDLEGQITLEQDPNGNSSKAENADSGGIVNTDPSPVSDGAAEGKQVASGSTSTNQAGSETLDQEGILKEASGTTSEGLVSAVVTGGAERGGLTGADVTAGSGLPDGSASSSSTSSSTTSNGGGNGAAGAMVRDKSVFVKLSNRINMLERNISLFTSYLDQISSSLKRSKNKTEDMQKTLDRRMHTLNETVCLLQKQLNESLISDMFCSLDAVHRVVSGVQEDVRDMIDLGLLLLTAVVILQAGIILILLVCCIALRQQFSRQHVSHTQTLTTLKQELNDLKQLLTKHKETNSVTNHHISSSNYRDPLTLSSLNISQDDFTVVTPRLVTPNGLGAATSTGATDVMTTRSNPNNRQQKPRPLENWHKVDNHRKSKTKPSKSK